MNIPRILAAVLVALSLLGSPAHSQGMLGVGISNSQVDPKGASSARYSRAAPQRRR